MRHITKLIAILFICVVTSCGTAKAPSQLRTIPLNQIWAFDMPGTREVNELEPEKFGDHTRDLPSEESSKLLAESMTYQIRAALKNKKPEKGKQAEHGFAVVGSGREALEGANSVLVKGEKPVDSFSTANNVTLVFFSHLCGQSVSLKQVQIQDNKIDVQYQFIPHMTANMTWHLALIPLGKLPAGKYRVEMAQIPGGKDSTGHLVGGLSAIEADRIVCQPFSFSVVDRKPKD
jgi:hypothetical protein